MARALRLAWRVTPGGSHPCRPGRQQTAKSGCCSELGVWLGAGKMHHRPLAQDVEFWDSWARRMRQYVAVGMPLLRTSVLLFGVAIEDLGGGLNAQVLKTLDLCPGPVDQRVQAIAVEAIIHGGAGPKHPPPGRFSFTPSRIVSSSSTRLSGDRLKTRPLSLSWLIRSAVQDAQVCAVMPLVLLIRGPLRIQRPAS